MPLIKFLLLIGVVFALIVFFASGAIVYFIYSLSNGTPPPEITHPANIPRWEDLPKVPREILLPGIAFIAAIWVLVGPGESKDSHRNSSRKGRTRRYDD